MRVLGRSPGVPAARQTAGGANLMASKTLSDASPSYRAISSVGGLIDALCTRPARSNRPLNWKARQLDRMWAPRRHPLTRMRACSEQHRAGKPGAGALDSSPMHCRSGLCQCTELQQAWSQRRAFTNAGKKISESRPRQLQATRAVDPLLAATGSVPGWDVGGHRHQRWFTGGWQSWVWCVIQDQPGGRCGPM